MKYEFDSEFDGCVRQTFQEVGIPPDQPIPRFARGDVGGRREGASFAKAVLALDAEVTNVTRTAYMAKADDGYEVPVLAYQVKQDRDHATLEPAVLYLHGGGMMFGSAELFEPITKSDVAATGVAHFSVNYRVAPEAPHPTPVEDCYAALLWLHSQGKALGIDNSRIAVAGLSAGGGLAAAVCLLARDRGLIDNPPIAKQVLLEPMLDDRNIEPGDEALAPFATWTWDDNWTGWNALLENRAGLGDISAYAAPARARNLEELPPTYIDVGTLDIFAKEDEDYALRLKNAGVEVEWHLYQGVPHGFELRGRQSVIVKQAYKNRRAAVQSLLLRSERAKLS
ncbi:alpha/beta hydrolase [Pleomassaria siparia CBS 279.74]|uniref:Alpha/beta hydrolase n=1 Tax=Pleomassaria siparia CBS 279.74 TaxID=1314801 RepID=A0A6G1K9C4_9PLEO|nr:alpha/beta hydrolase [Pleomassaria siparia CBS 279.74]